MFAARFEEGGRSEGKHFFSLKQTEAYTYREEREVWERLWRRGGAGSGGCARRRECLEDALMSGSSGGGVGEYQRRRTVTKQSGEARCSGCSGEDNMVEVASVDEEGARDEVK